jgi:hypothetical protein
LPEQRVRLAFVWPQGPHPAFEQGKKNGALTSLWGIAVESAKRNKWALCVVSIKKSALGCRDGGRFFMDHTKFFML